MAGVSELLQKNKSFLFGLSTFNRSQRTHLLKNASRSQVLSVVEIILNILKNNFKIPDTVFQHMQKYKHIFRRIIEKQPWKRRRELLIKIAAVIAKVLKRILNEIYEQFMNDEI